MSGPGRECRPYVCPFPPLGRRGARWECPGCGARYRAAGRRGWRLQLPGQVLLSGAALMVVGYALALLAMVAWVPPSWGTARSLTLALAVTGAAGVVLGALIVVGVGRYVNGR